MLSRPWAVVEVELNHRRERGISGEGQYRPHLIFEDVNENGFIYYGVMLWLYGDSLAPGQSGRAFVSFVYMENDAPPLCKPGAYFEIREGLNIIGTGRVAELGSGKKS